ncbi:MAG: AAA family ATPase [Planctomycetes bacterium]|nr:AAA family ATPase [Planctomycetota bacterium]
MSERESGPPSPHVREFRFRGYRSLRDLHLQPGPVTVLVGENGCGKTNIYRAIERLAQSARGEFARSFADEGGLSSALWAGGRRNHEVKLISLVVRAEPFSYELTCGLSGRRDTVFDLDPEVASERVWIGDVRRASNTLVERDKSVVQVMSEDGHVEPHPVSLRREESVLSQLRDADRYPELAQLREMFAGWRFYHSFRSDRDAPARHPNTPCRTPVLADDGRDLSNAIATIFEDGDADRFRKAMATLFPKGTFGVGRLPGGDLGYQVTIPDLKRPLGMRELSDGELRFICLVAALLTPEPPRLLVLNEPETSLHPRLIPELAELIAHATERSQLIVTTHSHELANRLRELTGEEPIPLALENGETRVVGAGLIGHRRD